MSLHDSLLSTLSFYFLSLQPALHSQSLYKYHLFCPITKNKEGNPVI